MNGGEGRGNAKHDGAKIGGMQGGKEEAIAGERQLTCSALLALDSLGGLELTRRARVLEAASGLLLELQVRADTRKVGPAQERV